MKKCLMICLSAFYALSLKADVISWSGYYNAGAQCEYTILDDNTVRIDKVFPLGESDSYKSIYIPAYLPDGSGRKFSEIAENAFSEFASVKEVHFNGGSDTDYAIRKIGEYAFANTEITSIQILPSVETIGAFAFANCKKLSTFIASAPGEGSFTTENDGAAGSFLLTSDKTTLVAANATLEAVTTIPNTVTKIGTAVFFRNQTLRSVTIPNSVKEIGDFAFALSYLESLELPSSVEIVGEQAFRELHLARTITLHPGLKTVKAYGFFKCWLTDQIRLPTTLSYIGEYAFDECNSATIIFGGLPPENFTAFENSFCLDHTYAKEIRLPDTTINEVSSRQAWLDTGMIYTDSGYYNGYPYTRYWWGPTPEVRLRVVFYTPGSGTDLEATTYPVYPMAVGTGTIAGGGRYIPDEEVTLVAIPGNDAVFSGWFSSTGALLSAKETYTFTMPEKEVNVTAYFSPVLQLNAYIKARKLMPKNDAKQELLDAKDIYTEEGLKGLAEGAPLVKVKDSYATVKIAIQKATDLEGQWQEAGSKEIPVQMKITSNAAFYKVVKGE